MIGGRLKEGGIYPESNAALKHNAGVKKETNDPKIAYQDCSKWEAGSRQLN